MRRYLYLYRYSFLFFGVFVLIISCNNDGSEKTATQNSTADTSHTVSPVQPQPATAIAISGTLDTLWVDSLKFASLQKGKLVFSFIFHPNDTLTLEGWRAKGLLDHSYDQNPDIKLIKGHASPLPYGPGIYFGNIILQRQDVDDIKDALKVNKAKYVLFAPQMMGAHIIYRIFVGKDNPSGFVKLFASVDTGIDANPSPPKNY